MLSCLYVSHQLSCKWCLAKHLRDLFYFIKTLSKQVLAAPSQRDKPYLKLDWNKTNLYPTFYSFFLFKTRSLNVQYCFFLFNAQFIFLKSFLYSVWWSNACIICRHQLVATILFAWEISSTASRINPCDTPLCTSAKPDWGFELSHF